MKPRSVPAYQPPTPQDTTSGFDPFMVAKQLDQLRSSFSGGGAAPFQMPQVQPKPIEFGGQLPYQQGAPAPQQSVAPKNVGTSDWGSKTATLQQQFPSLRHTSGYRSPEHNAKTPGASPTSYHMQRDANGNARANDYVGSARDMAAAAAWAKQNGAKEVLIHNAGTGQHLHIAWS